MTGELFGIYVHWPFCASKCPYCDFNSHVSERIDQSAWRTAYVKEIEYYAALTPGRTVTSIFFGGGTPSLMEPQTAAAVIDAIAKNWTVAPDAEITLEANPTSVEIDKFSGFRAAGVNRVSIGIQALNDQDLKFLGRKHDVSEALQALETAEKIFDRYTYDLIYARPKQSVKDWRQELEKALKIAGEHLSLYQLTIEEGTPFYMQHARGDFAVPGQDNAGELYEATQEVMDRAGLPAYEVSNHAKPGQESRHNMTYWRYGDYAGIGPGAHGRLTINNVKQATRGHRAPEIWLKRVNESGHGAHPFEEILPAQRFSEALMMGLRLREGVPLDRLSRESGQDWRQRLDENKIGKLAGEGLLEFDGAMLRPTMAGLQRLNGVLSYLL
jgi:putative oxygen-independent coproporphyrinogen III oxidase